MKAVNEIFCCNRCAIAPFGVVAKVKDKFIDIWANLPTRCDRGHGLLVLGAVFDQALIQGHVNASLRLAGRYVGVERFRLRSGYIPQHIVLRRNGLAKIAATAQIFTPADERRDR